MKSSYRSNTSEHKRIPTRPPDSKNSLSSAVSRSLTSPRTKGILKKSRLRSTGSHVKATKPALSMPVDIDLFTGNAVSTENSVLIIDGSLSTVERTINYSIREFPRIYYSINILVVDTQQKWTVYVPFSESISELIQLWSMVPRYQEKRQMGGWILSCTNLEFNDNIIVGVKFDHEKLNKRCVSELSRTLNTLVTKIQSVVRQFLVNLHLSKGLYTNPINSNQHTENPLHTKSSTSGLYYGSALENRSLLSSDDKNSIRGKRKRRRNGKRNPTTGLEAEMSAELSFRERVDDMAATYLAGGSKSRQNATDPIGSGWNSSTTSSPQYHTKSVEVTSVSAVRRIKNAQHAPRASISPRSPVSPLHMSPIQSKQQQAVLQEIKSVRSEVKSALSTFREELGTIQSEMQVQQSISTQSSVGSPGEYSIGDTSTLDASVSVLSRYEDEVQQLRLDMQVMLKQMNEMQKQIDDKQKSEPTDNAKESNEDVEIKSVQSGPNSSITESSSGQLETVRHSLTYSPSYTQKRSSIQLQSKQLRPVVKDASLTAHNAHMLLQHPNEVCPGVEHWEILREMEMAGDDPSIAVKARNDENEVLREQAKADAAGKIKRAIMKVLTSKRKEKLLSSAKLSLRALLVMVERSEDLSILKNAMETSLQLKHEVLFLKTCTRVKNLLDSASQELAHDKIRSIVDIVFPDFFAVVTLMREFYANPFLQNLGLDIMEAILASRNDRNLREEVGTSGYLDLLVIVLKKLCGHEEICSKAVKLAQNLVARTAKNKHRLGNRENCRVLGESLLRFISVRDMVHHIVKLLCTLCRDSPVIMDRMGEAGVCECVIDTMRACVFDFEIISAVSRIALVLCYNNHFGNQKRLGVPAAFQVYFDCLLASRVKSRGTFVQVSLLVMGVCSKNEDNIQSVHAAGFCMLLKTIFEDNSVDDDVLKTTITLLYRFCSCPGIQEELLSRGLDRSLLDIQSSARSSTVVRVASLSYHRLFGASAHSSSRSTFSLSGRSRSDLRAQRLKSGSFLSKSPSMTSTNGGATAVAEKDVEKWKGQAKPSLEKHVKGEDTLSEQIDQSRQPVLLEERGNAHSSDIVMMHPSESRGLKKSLSSPGQKSVSSESILRQQSTSTKSDPSQAPVSRRQALVVLSNPKDRDINRSREIAASKGTKSQDLDFTDEGDGSGLEDKSSGNCDSNIGPNSFHRMPGESGQAAECLPVNSGVVNASPSYHSMPSTDVPTKLPRESQILDTSQQEVFVENREHTMEGKWTENCATKEQLRLATLLSVIDSTPEANIIIDAIRVSSEMRNVALAKKTIKRVNDQVRDAKEKKISSKLVVALIDKPEIIMELLFTFADEVDLVLIGFETLVRISYVSGAAAVLGTNGAVNLLYHFINRYYKNRAVYTAALTLGIRLTQKVISNKRRAGSLAGFKILLKTVKYYLDVQDIVVLAVRFLWICIENAPSNQKNFLKAGGCDILMDAYTCDLEHFETIDIVSRLIMNLVAQNNHENQKAFGTSANLLKFFKELHICLPHPKSFTTVSMTICRVYTDAADTNMSELISCDIPTLLCSLLEDCNKNRFYDPDVLYSIVMVTSHFSEIAALRPAFESSNLPNLFMTLIRNEAVPKKVVKKVTSLIKSMTDSKTTESSD